MIAMIRTDPVTYHLYVKVMVGKRGTSHDDDDANNDDDQCIAI